MDEINQLNKEITELSGIWYRIVNVDHHKVRDCHWYVQTVFSYGNDPIYEVQHYGYVWKEYKQEYSSYIFALIGLRDTLHIAIKEQYEWAKENIEDFSQESQLIINIINEYINAK